MDKLVKEVQEKMAVYAEKRGADLEMSFNSESMILNISLSAVEANGDSKMVGAAFGPSDFLQGITAAEVVEFVNNAWIKAVEADKEGGQA